MRSNLLNILFCLVLLNRNLTFFQKILFITFILITYSIYYKFDRNFKLFDSDSKIHKTFIIRSFTDNKNINYFYDCCRLFLKSQNWEELLKYEAKKDNIIGFCIYNNKQNYIIKSQINYGFFTQQDNIFSNKIRLIEAFKNKEYFNDVILLRKTNNDFSYDNLINEINKKSKKHRYYKKKGLDYSNGKQIFILDKKDKSKNYIKNLNNFLNSLVSSIFIIDKLYDTIKFKVNEINYNESKLNIESKHGRRSMIRFFIIVFLKDDKIYFYKYKNLCVYLNVLPSYGNLEIDIKNPGSLISNYFNGKKLDKKYTKNLNDSNLLNVNTYRNISYESNEKKYPNELFSELFCLSNEDIIQKDESTFNLINNSINKFIQDFAEIYGEEINCKNAKCFNKNFKSCFSIFTVDSIFTKENKLKILDINSNLSSINLRIFKKNKNIFNIYDVLGDIFKLCENKDNIDKFELIHLQDKQEIKKLYFLSEQQSSMYPEMVKSLNKRNLSRSLWRNPLNNNDNNINLYLGFVVKTESISDEKELYLDYLTFFLGEYSITNKMTGAIYDLGDKTDLYNSLKGDVMIPDFVDFNIFRGKNTNNYINTSKLLEIQNFISSNQSICSRFILKPSLGSQGDGINVIKYYEQFLDWYKNENKYEEWTISEFLNPKLFKNKKLNDNINRKAHIRSYFILVRDKNDNFDIYELNTRLLYFAVDKYDEDCVVMNKDNKYSFITNLALASEERNINYNTDNYTDLLSNYDDQIFNFKKMSDKITEYGVRCINLVGENNLKCFNEKYYDYEGCYQILAIDYLPINKNDIKLLEVNKGPGFKGLKSNLNLELVFDEIFNVTIDKFLGNEIIDLKFLRKVN